MKRFSLSATLVLLCLTLMAPAATGLETTAKACPDGPEYHYVSRNPQICLVILFFCDEDQAYFFNQCGCGCVDLFVRSSAAETSTTQPLAPTSLEDLLAPAEEAASTVCRAS